MKRETISSITLAAVIALGAVSILAGCHDKGTDPKPVKYNVYVGATTYVDGKQVDWIYVLDADSLTVLDSIPQSFYVDELAVSPDARYLYLLESNQYTDEDTIRKIDAETHETIWARHHPITPRREPGRMFLMDKGRLLFFDQELIQVSDGALVRRLEDSLYAGVGPSDGTEIACWTRYWPEGEEPEAIVRAVDLTDGSLRGHYRPPLSSGIPLYPFRASLHPEGRLVCCVGAYQTSRNVWFVVGDLETGETLYEYRLRRGRGDLVISPDGSLAIVGDHPVLGMFEGNPALDVFDLDGLTLLRQFDLIRCSQLRFVDGGSHIIAAPVSSFGSAGAMFRIDIQTLAIELETRSYTNIFGGMDVASRAGK